jgi:hypothetical protein|tara:strand:- start:312 stop:821 length:510 start_codon:yes stop_codon:yes gene_type:complete
MKIQTKGNINFHKLTEEELKSMLAFLMNECADSAQRRIIEGFEKEMDINGLAFEKNADLYDQFFKKGDKIMTETGKLKNSIDKVLASKSDKSSKVGSDVSYGEDHFEERLLRGTFTPARLWFFTTDNLGGETDTFLKQYADVLKALRKAAQSTYIPFFLKKLKTSMRIL